MSIALQRIDLKRAPAVGESVFVFDGDKLRLLGVLREPVWFERVRCLPRLFVIRFVDLIGDDGRPFGNIGRTPPE